MPNISIQTLNINDIVIPEDRFRKEFSEVDLYSLANSILERGLLHAPVVRNDGKTLVAGERRLRALRLIFEGIEYENRRTFKYNNETFSDGIIPTVKLEKADNLTYMETEVEENLIRKDLTWQEQIESKKKLHELRVAQKMENYEEHTIRDTADEIADLRGIQPGPKTTVRTREDLLISEHLDDPDVAKAKTRNDALKVVRKKLEREHRLSLADRYNGVDFGSEHKIINGDLFEVIPTLEKETFDCIIFDPPYGVDADQFTNQSAVKHDYADTKEYSRQVIEYVFSEGLRITKKRAHLYMFHDICSFEELKELGQKIGWYVWRTPIIWARQNNEGILPRPKHGPRRIYESILYAIKGDKEAHNVDGDVLFHPNDRSVERAAHKPPSLYHDLLRRSCLPGDYAIDPCAGTGPIIPAATKLKVKAWAIERDPVAFAQILERPKDEEPEPIEI